MLYWPHNSRVSLFPRRESFSSLQVNKVRSSLTITMQNDFAPRQMVQGNWTCAQCGTAITELPFQPDGVKPILCKDCHRSKRQERRSFAPSSPRPMVQGNWTCASCGAAVTQLPFQPDGVKPIYCSDCHRSQRSQRSF